MEGEDWGKPPVALKLPALEGHKYDRGHLLVISGGLEKAGAARLAARNGLRVGAGLVTVACPDEAALVHGSGPAALMLRRIGAPEDLAEVLEAGKVAASVAGPGLSPDAQTRAVVSVLARGAGALVLDAGAVSAFEGHLDALAGLCAREAPVVLTPHAGEFARLFGPIEDRAGAAAAAAARLGATVVLKGPRSLVAGGAEIWEGPRGARWLATAGTGDVLAGVIGGLLAQGYRGAEAARLGVWLHAAASWEAGAYMTADDLEEALRGVLVREVAKEGADLR